MQRELLVPIKTHQKCLSENKLREFLRSSNFQTGIPVCHNEAA